MEGDEIEYLFILAKGIYIFQEIDGKEFLLGTVRGRLSMKLEPSTQCGVLTQGCLRQVSGPGQVVGERDFLASKPHSVSLVAEIEGTAIAVPVHAVLAQPLQICNHAV